MMCVVFVFFIEGVLDLSDEVDIESLLCVMVLVNQILISFNEVVIVVFNFEVDIIFDNFDEVVGELDVNLVIFGNIVIQEMCDLLGQFIVFGEGFGGIFELCKMELIVEVMVEMVVEEVCIVVEVLLINVGDFKVQVDGCVVDVIVAVNGLVMMGCILFIVIVVIGLGIVVVIVWFYVFVMLFKCISFMVSIMLVFVEGNFDVNLGFELGNDEIGDMVCFVDVFCQNVIECV